ncbi:hypothetical protein C8F04DRAFT_1279617 [Mycena alexandri]|uniref:MYND-type domain-containing protein n=1 Tax=Mycena alexandri TaxID=1745969 RepID=A0AAD6RYR9_9AGAR|nr:hypothetical protein C8F04DRAFT_1279617 [Mycena alexandri]
MLPVIWANLDPARIPHPEKLDSDTPTSETVALLDIALRSLGLLEQVKNVPSGVYGELWPRVWKWTELLQVHYSLASFPSRADALPLEIETDLFRVRILQLISLMLTDTGATPLILATPNIYTFLGQTWAGLNLEYALESWLTALWRFLHTCEWNAENLEELIDGAGGVQPFTQLVVRHIYVTTAADELQTRDTALLLELLAFSQTSAVQGHLQLQRSLLAEGLARVLTEALGHLCSAKFGPGMALERCLQLLVQLVGRESGYLHLPEAVEGGLITALLLTGSQEFPGVDLSKHVQFWFRDVLPRAMVYFPVIAAIQKVIPAAKNLALALEDDSKCSPHMKVHRQTLRLDWRAFFDLAASRLFTLDRFQSPAYMSIKLCDNHYLKCGAIKRTTEIKRCSGCRICYYCSPECQRFAWTHGGHRDFCKAYQLCSPSRLRHFRSKRDEAFLRLLVLQDYKAHKVAVLRTQVLFVRANPKVPFSTIFDYTRGSCRILVAALKDLPAESLPGALEASARTDSATSLHHILINSGEMGNAPALWLVALNFLLRSSNSILEDEVLRIASTGGLDGSALTQEIEKLSGVEVLETYQ